MTYFYICSRCGSIADITAAPHDEGVTWMCADCDCELLTEFTDSTAALVQSNTIREANFNATMERLERSLRLAGSLIVCSLIEVHARRWGKK